LFLVAEVKKQEACAGGRKTWVVRKKNTKSFTVREPFG
jgi:hypothetical protein